METFNAPRPIKEINLLTVLDSSYSSNLRRFLQGLELERTTYKTGKSSIVSFPDHPTLKVLGRTDLADVPSGSRVFEAEVRRVGA